MEENRISEWPREVYVKRPDGFFHASPSLLIYDSLGAYLTKTVKSEVKQTSLEHATLSGLTKELQPLGIGVNWVFKVNLRATLVQWRIKGEHTFTKTGRHRRASHATICLRIIGAWIVASVSTVVWAFKQAGIVTVLPSSSYKPDSDDDIRNPGLFDASITKLLNSDTEDEKFDRFVEEEWLSKWVYFAVPVFYVNYMWAILTVIVTVAVIVTCDYFDSYCLWVEWSLEYPTVLFCFMSLIGWCTLCMKIDLR